MTIEVRAVSGKRGTREFVAFAWRLYDRATYPDWVAPLRATVVDALDEAKNPFYRDAARELFIAYDGTTPVGRIAAIENRAHNAFHRDRVGFFGFFECVNDQRVAGALLEAASAWLAERGLDAIRGPVNPSMNYECGALVDGFQYRPSFMTTWNPPYYDALITGAGLHKAKDLLSFWFSSRGDLVLPDFVNRLAERSRAKGGITFRDMDVSRFEEEVALFWDIYNDAWEQNWGFVPMSKDEFWHMAKDLKPLVLPGVTLVAEANGVACGFMLCLPDYNDVLQGNRNGRLWPTGLLRLLWGRYRKIRSGRIMALGVRREFRSRSILALLTQEIMRRGRMFESEGADASWLLEDNLLIVKPMRDMGAEQRRRWRVYEGGISDGKNGG